MANYTYMAPKDLVAMLDDPASRTTLVVIDCRDGDRDDGYINGSLHAPSGAYTDAMYASLAKAFSAGGIVNAVFHCALSQVRGPKGANRFAIAKQGAGGCALPNVFVLSGGWESFYYVYGQTRKDLYTIPE